jgi:hypothetical protein
MIATSIEQSKKLIDLGLNSETADMHYVRKVTDHMGNKVNGEFSYPKYGNPNSEYANYLFQNFTSYETLPAWSLCSLLELMPSAIESNGHYYCLQIGKLANETEWYVSYDWEGWTYKIMKGDLKDDAVFDMMVWLLENNYIKNTNEDREQHNNS